MDPHQAEQIVQATAQNIQPWMAGNPLNGLPYIVLALIVEVAALRRDVEALKQTAPPSP